MHDGYIPAGNQVAAPDQLVFLDIEVTYPRGEDQSRRLMELALVDGYGQCIYQNYFNPGVELNNRFANKGLHDRLLRHGARLEDEYQNPAAACWQACGGMVGRQRTNLLP